MNTILFCTVLYVLLCGVLIGSAAFGIAIGTLIHVRYEIAGCIVAFPVLTIVAVLALVELAEKWL